MSLARTKVRPGTIIGTPGHSKFKISFCVCQGGHAITRRGHERPPDRFMSNGVDYHSTNEILLIVLRSLSKGLLWGCGEGDKKNNQ